MILELDLAHGGPALDFQAHIPIGGITALLGPSGSGKTSILRAIAGLLRLRRQVVRVDGKTWSDSALGLHVPARERPIGLVSQHYALFPHLTALGNVEIALSHLSPVRRAERAKECLALVHVAGLDERYPRELSGGQRQRVALARAIARGPTVLLLDEPFSAVDRTTKKRLYVELLRLHAQLGATIVLVTHDLDEAAQLASHLCLVHRGALLQSGPTREVLAGPSSEAAARLLDIPNIFDGRIDAAEEGLGRLLHWGRHVLRIGPTAPLAARVRWAIQPANVMMVRPDKPWSSHLENPVPVRVADLIELGGDVLVWLEPAGLPAERLQMRLPCRVLNRHPIARGQTITVCLRSSDVMLLAPDGAGT